MTASKYRKKPVVIEAFQWVTGEAQLDAIEEWMGDASDDLTYDGDVASPLDPETGEDWGRLTIHTPEGDHTVTPRDYIIRGVQGEFYPCKPDIFAETYEKEADNA